MRKVSCNPPFIACREEPLSSLFRSTEKLATDDLLIEASGPIPYDPVGEQQGTLLGCQWATHEYRSFR
jgi:hypothetical protein